MEHQWLHRPEIGHHHHLYYIHPFSLRYTSKPSRERSLRFDLEVAMEEKTSKGLITLISFISRLMPLDIV